MRFKTWMGSAVLVPAVFACAAQQQTADGEPTRPGGIEIGFADKEGLGVVPAGAEDGVWPSAEVQLADFLAEPQNRGLRPGNYLVDHGYLVAIAVESIIAETNKPYSDARRDAFNLARIKAMDQIARMLRATVSTSLVTRLIPEDQRAEAEETVGQILDGEGADREEVAKVYREIAERIAISVDQMVSGVQVYKVFEGPDDLAILMTWSEDNTERLRQALIKPDAKVKGKSAQVSISDWVYAQEDALLFTHGSQVRTDENGELCIVVFGQADLRGRNPQFRSLAMEDASNIAAGALREFLATQVISGAGLGSTSLQVIGSSGVAQSRRDSDGVKRLVAEALEMSIPLPIYEGTFQHPRNAEKGIKTAVVVLSTNVSQLQSIDRMRQQMLKVPAVVAMMPTPPPPTSPSGAPVTSSGEPSQKPKPKPQSSGGQGATGEAP